MRRKIVFPAGIDESHVGVWSRVGYQRYDYVEPDNPDAGVFLRQADKPVFDEERLTKVREARRAQGDFDRATR